MNRLGIFLTYDPEGIVDEYIEYLLNDINPLLTKLIIVCNGFLLPESRIKLEKYSDSIFVRENIGFDFLAWKETMFDYYGYARVREYDELVLFNDSFFGPFFSFENVFDDMEKKAFDFWGLTVHGEVETVNKMCPYGYRPRYIQTYFLVFNKRMLNDEAFIQFWKNIPVYETFQEVSEKCSAVLTRFFSDRGYSWGVYSDTSDLEESREKNICHHAFDTYELIVNRKYPIIKRKSFVLGKKRFVQYNSGLDLSRAFEYIKEHNLYDTDLIYKHIIRRYDVAEIKESLNLSWIIPTDCNNEIVFTKKQVLVCFHISDAYKSKRLLNFVNNIPCEFEVHIYTENEKTYSEVNEIEIDFGNAVIINANCNYIECLVHVCREEVAKYEYLGFFHDFEAECDDTQISKNSYVDMIYENLLHSSNYILNILNKLDSNKFYGMVVCPPPMHGKNYTDLVNSSKKTDIAAIEWNSVMGEISYVPKTNNILSVGCCFWGKTNALKSIGDSHADYIDIRFLAENKLYSEYWDHIVPYIAQKNGFLTSWCISSEYASSEYESMRYMLENVYKPHADEFEKVNLNYPNYNITLRNYISKLIKENKKLKTKLKSQKPKIVKVPVEKKIEVPVEVPVLVEIGLARALKNYIRKKNPFRKKDK